MFGLFSGPRRARQVADSIAQLIHMLSYGRETLGPKNPERLLRRIGQVLGEEPISDSRMLRLLVPMTDREIFPVSLIVQPNDKCMLMIDGNQTYAGFHLSCSIPWGAPMIDLQHGARYRISRQSRLLYALCKKFPDVVEMSDFR